MVPMAHTEGLMPFDRNSSTANPVDSGAVYTTSTSSRRGAGTRRR